MRYQESEMASVTGTAPPDLSVYYLVEADDARLDDLADELLSRDGIVGAYVAPPAEPAVDLATLNDMTPAPEPAPPATPDFTPRQIYLDAAPAGIDARFAWTRPGGRGAGVRIIDIEGAWRFDHEDLIVNQGGTVGTPSADVSWRNHGTAVVSEFGGDVNVFGVTGICPDSHTRGFSIFGPGNSPAQAIRAAADALSAGDIILIELHRPGPGASGAGQDGFIAMEWWPAEFDAIRYATNKGVLVVEAAGNGSRNLDDPIYNTPQPGFPPGWTNPFNRANRDSGRDRRRRRSTAPGHARSRPRPGPLAAGVLQLGRPHRRTGLGPRGDGRRVRRPPGRNQRDAVVHGHVQRDLQRLTHRRRSVRMRAGRAACAGAGRAHTGADARSPAVDRYPQQDAPGRPASQRIGNRPNLRQLLATPKTIAKDILKDNKFEKIERKELKEKPEKRERSRRRTRRSSARS